MVDLKVCWNFHLRTFGQKSSFCIFFPDSTTQASPTRDALHPEPGQHRVHLFDGPGGVCHQNPRGRQRKHCAATSIQL